MRLLNRQLLPLLFCLIQLVLPNANAQAQEAIETVASNQGDSHPSVPAQSQNPHLPLAEAVVGRTESEKIYDRALYYLRRYEQQNPRPTRKPAGLLGTVSRYLLALLPQLYVHGPATDGSSVSLPGPIADAVRLLDQAAQMENTDAIYLLAQMNFYGNFTHPKNYPEALNRYTQLAAFGNSSAQHMLGFMYATGIGGAVERDQAKALLYHTYAARGGDTRAQMTVAYRHHSGIGTSRNCDAAIEHYKKAADKAIEWYRSGPPGGMAWVPDSYRLADDEGGVYGEGASFSSAGNNAQKGGPGSDAHAALDDVLEYLDLMSRKGDFKATFSLGRIHYDGQKGLARNMKSAKWYFMKVAKLYWQRDGRVIESEKPGLEKIAAKSAGYLGRMFLRGEGVEQSYERAQIWFSRGIKSGGDAGSQYGMGLMYLDGLGVLKNTIRAQEYLKAAADFDYAPAQVTLGALYLDQGTASDITVAGRYFELAARYGHIEAFYYLAELFNKGVGRDRDCGMANAYYKNVAEKAEPLLSSFAEANRAFVDGNHELALIDYLHAAEQGFEKGQANVAYMLDQAKSRWALPSWMTITIAQPRPSLLQNAQLALVHWTRSAKQANIDSMVKMGDYYLYGIGAQADMEKAASCFTAASEYHQSAQALFNLGWMHENGVGLDQDFHLAKRYYDQALETNDEAYLPVTLSLFKLRLRSAWNTLTHGRVNSIQDEPVAKKQWSLAEWISNFLGDDRPYYGDADYDDNFLPENDPMPGGDVDGMYDDIVEDGFLESLIILGLAGALLLLIYYRQQQQRAHAAREQAGVHHENDGHAGQQQDRGLFPDPNDPAFNQWAVGGIGH